MSKYILTTETIKYFGKTLYRIKSTKAFGSISKDELGGFIEKPKNLDDLDNAWVSGDARVYGEVQK